MDMNEYDDNYDEVNMANGEDLSYPTQRIDPESKVATKQLESIFDLDSDFDFKKACRSLIERRSQGEKYLIEKKIAEGGMGAIYEVIDRDLKRISVLKIIHPKIMENQQMFISFIDEARITGRLEHPNIIPVHDLGVLGEDKLYFSMKRIEGIGLHSMLQKIRDGDKEIAEKYSLYNLLTLFRKVCDAVAYAHSKEIIHRDIKPENIMVGDYGEVLLVDWGLARYLQDNDDDLAIEIPEEDINSLSDAIGLRAKTQYGLVKGTPAFMSPEQAKGLTDQIDTRSDIFLLGSTLYTVATLTLPFQGVDIYEILDNAELGNIQSPQERAPERELPPELCRIIMKAMAHEPENRYQKVEDMIQDIDNLLEGRTTSEQREYIPGEIIVQEGDTGHEAYVIISGEVEVFKKVNGRIVKLVHLKKGDCIGEMSMISEAPRSASVRAVKQTCVVVITEDSIKHGLDKLPPWMGNIVQTLVERLRDANTHVHPLLSSDCTYHVLQQLRMFYICYGNIVDISGKTIVAIDLQHAIKEISSNLCLSIERVSNVLSGVIASGMIDVADGDYHLFIPNFELFSLFIDYVNAKFRPEETVDTTSLSSFYYSKDQQGAVFIQRQGKSPTATSGFNTTEHLPVLSKPVENVLGRSSEEDIHACFEDILKNIRDNPQKA